MFEDTSVALSGFLSVAQAATRLGVSESRVRQMIQAKELRAERVEGRWLLPVEAIERRQDL
jgi:excisionase family DNA binding protein